MPGPKMGPRPPDFDEDLVRRSPTFRKWEELLPGATLRYACREFSKGSGDDEERLMRRIMIARRNNVRDHQALKWARRMQSTKDKETTKVAVSSSSSSQQQPRKNQKGANASRLESNKESENSGGYNSNHSRSETEASLSRTSRLLSGEQGYSNRSRFETEAIISRTSHLLPGEQGPPSGRRSRRPTTLISDEAIKEEMDVDAVESTRSYKQWSSLPNGAQFLYNQKYIKGHEAHDWLLKKNIWRRMRYRRENKKMVEQMLSLEKGQPPTVAQQQKSRKRRHDATAVSNSVKGSTATTNRNPAVEGLDAIMVDAAAPTMVVSTTSTLTTEAAAAAALRTSTPNETNRQEMVASTASEIVDHALLSTNTGDGVAAPPTVNAATSETITISIGELHQQQQQLQDHHHHQHHNHHHHDAAESATAFAASIALAGVGMSIGTDGDLVNSNHETAVADSAAVEAAVAAALAATDVKSNAYHHHLSHSSVHHHHEGLMDANDVVLHLGSNDPPAETSTMTSDGRGSHPHSHSVQPPSAEASSPLPTEASAAGLGLALDAAAKLAAAAVTTSASDEAVLAVSEAITASANAGGVGGESDSDDDRETLII